MELLLSQIRQVLLNPSLYQLAKKSYKVLGLVQLLSTVCKRLCPHRCTLDHFEAQIPFETLKSKLVAHPVLIFPDFKKPFTLYNDASDLAIGYILGQRDKQDMEHVIAYGGHSMNMAERRWGITDKEGLALIEGVRYFKHYLVGKPFTIYTDHSALKKLDLAKQTSGRRQRWYDYLQGFDFTIIHKPGHVHQNADALSRRTYTEHGSTEEPNTFPMTSALTLGNDLKEYKLSYTFTYTTYPSESP